MEFKYLFLPPPLLLEQEREGYQRHTYLKSLPIKDGVKRKLFLVRFRKLVIAVVWSLGMRFGKVWKLEFMRVVKPSLIGRSLRHGELGDRDGHSYLIVLYSIGSVVVRFNVD